MLPGSTLQSIDNFPHRIWFYCACSSQPGWSWHSQSVQLVPMVPACHSLCPASFLTKSFSAEPPNIEFGSTASSSLPDIPYQSSWFPWCLLFQYLCQTIVIALGYSLPLVAKLAHMFPQHGLEGTVKPLNQTIALGVVRCGFKLLRAQCLTGVQHKYDRRFISRSDRRASGTPKNGTTTSTKSFTILDDLWSGIGNTSGHLVKKS